MRLHDLHVTICGAATGGSAAALLLARAGARVTLVDRVTAPSAVGAGIALAENGLAVMEGLGLEAALHAAVPVRGVRITDATGRTLLAAPRPAPRMVMLKRSTLQDIFVQAVAREPNITTILGARVVHAGSDGTVAIQRGDVTQELRADLVIGADGVHSTVREGGDFGAKVRATGIRYVRALVLSGDALGVEAWTSAGCMGSFNVDGGKYLFASCATPALRAALDARDLASFQRIWSQALPAAASLLYAIPPWSTLLVNEVVRVDCRRFFDERLVLMGDAAHAMAPNLGQGANSALVDAAVLLDELRTGASVRGAITAYDARRLPAVRTVAETAARIERLCRSFAWTASTISSSATSIKHSASTIPVTC